MFAVLVVAGRINAWPQLGRQTGDVAIAATPTAVDPLTPELAQAFSDAIVLTASLPRSFGYPYADATAGTLVIRTIDGTGDTAARAWVAAGSSVASGVKTRTLPRPTVPARFAITDRSYADLERIIDDATRVEQARVPDADAIYRLEPDYESNRVTVVVSRSSSALEAALLARYGSTSIVIRVVPTPALPRAATRNADYNPFLGGATLHSPMGDCTSGFPWTNISYEYMLTAGHCGPNGGSYSAAVPMGTGYPGTGENWDTGVGTVYFSGQSVYRGDLALVVMSGSQYGEPKVYYRGTTDSYYRTVREMWSRSPLLYDRFCTDGGVSLEVCGWQVLGVAITIKYKDGTWARRVSYGMRPKGTGNCIQNGDSGGPVYTIRADSAVAAKGIISAELQDLNYCYVYFTDIWDAYYGLPGVLKVG